MQYLPDQWPILRLQTFAIVGAVLAGIAALTSVNDEVDESPGGGHRVTGARLLHQPPSPNRCIGTAPSA